MLLNDMDEAIYKTTRSTSMLHLSSIAQGEPRDIIPILEDRSSPSVRYHAVWSGAELVAGRRPHDPNLILDNGVQPHRRTRRREAPPYASSRGAALLSLVKVNADCSLIQLHRSKGNIGSGR